MATLIKTTADGRRLEVVGLALTLDGKLEADELVEIERHPNRRAIRAAAPEASHMAGRVTLTKEEAEAVRAAFARAEGALLETPTAINERFRLAVLRKAREEGVE